MNIVSKNGGKKREKKILPETHAYHEQKTMEKKSGKSAKTRFFYKHTNIVIKKLAERNARKKFSKNTRIGYPKIVGKNRLKKVRKTVF